MLLCGLVACGPKSPPANPESAASAAPQRGSIEVIARLEEIPEGAIFKRDLYDYATVLKYRVMKANRGALTNDVIFVGQYNPFKPRSEAADKRVPDVGGNVKQFRAGDVHRLSLEAPIEDHFMGGIVNKYFGQTTGPIYWAVWTDAAK